MKIIDAHTHWYPPQLASDCDLWAAQNSEPYWGALVGKRADLKPSLQSFPSLDKFLRDMDEAQIERAVILGWYWQNPQNCAAQNREIARAIKGHSDRLSAFASVSPSSKTFLASLQEAKDLGFIGVGELHDKIQDFDFLSANFDDFCAVCSELNFPINVHLSDPRGKDYPNKALTSNSAAYKAAQKNRDTKFIFAHFGGGDVFEPDFEFLDNVFYDCAANTFLYKEAALKNMSKPLSQKMIFGSDYPLRLYPKKFADCEMAEFKNSALLSVLPAYADAFFAGNFQKLFV